MKNPIYYGEFRWAGKIYRGTHAPLISRELFWQIRDVMDNKGRRKIGQQKHHWAFQGLLSSGHYRKQFDMFVETNISRQ